MVVTQAVVSAVYWLAFEVFLVFFPSLNSHRHIFLGVMLGLSFSPLLFLILTHNRDIWLLNALCVFSMVFFVFNFYFMFASLPIFLLYLTNGFSLLTGGNWALGIALAATAYGLINARIIRQINLSLELPNLPGWWKGKTAVLASDLHLGQILNKGFAKRIVGLINRLNPEIVFIPGDFYDGVHTDFQGLADIFKKIKAPLGIYFCSGNHELFAGYQKCESALNNAGIKILENQKVEIEGLQIAGVAYKSERLPNLPQILAGLGLDTSKPSVLLKHVPLQIEEAAAAGVSLQLSGHSHQGQVWPGQHISKPYFRGFDYGLKRLKNLLVYTSSGAGTWGPPMRVLTKSELVQITFK